jgi:hypothetical protein
MKKLACISPFSTAIAIACSVLALASAADPVRAQTATGTATTPPLPAPPGSDVDTEYGSTRTRPARGILPSLGVPQAAEWARELDQGYDRYLDLKKGISDKYNLDFSLDFSYIPQFGTSGHPVHMVTYYPSLTWRPFTDTRFGSGEFNITTGYQNYFSKTNNSKQSAELNLITFANDWTSDNDTWSTLAYTHTLPGGMKWLSVTVGQYNLFSFDPNEYASNAQTSFLSYSFAQDATQTFPNAGFGGYLSVKTPDGHFNVSGGAQDATDPNGGTLTARGYEHGSVLGWGNAQWTPTIAGLGAGIYSLLVYYQPSIPNLSSATTGISFSASQQLGPKYGAFVRANNATGSVFSIRTSLNLGGVWNDPVERNSGDQAGLAFGWNRTNHHVVGQEGVREGEWVTEAFYKYTIFKGLNFTPDVQLFWNPALNQKADPEAVFTVRLTSFF